MTLRGLGYTEGGNLVVERYSAEGSSERTETTIKSIKVAEGGFWITESFSKRGRWLGFKRKTTYFLTVIDPQTIEIWDGMVIHRYAKCGPERPPI
jgi:hypothetical protein